MKHFFLVASLAFCIIINAQNKGRKHPPVLTEISNKDIVQSIFPAAAKVDKVNVYWFRIVDDKKNVLGYAMSSEYFCKDIIGYNNATPIMVITDKNFIIVKISILSHWETLSYVSKLETRGFFNLWVGKSLTQAKDVVPDGYTGATMTALAVAKNVDFLLTKGVKVLPKIRK